MAGRALRLSGGGLAAKAAMLLLVALAGLFAQAAPSLAGAMLDAIRQRGNVRCGVNAGAPGYAAPASDGSWKGFNVDLCRGLAISVFKDAGKVIYVPLTNQQRFPALQTGEVDVLSNNTTKTLTREASLGFTFSPVVLYDGGGLIVAKSLNVERAEQLDGATICFQPGGTTELNVNDFFRRHNLRFTAVVIDSLEEVRKAFFSGRCDAYANDQSQLAAERGSAADPSDYVILPDLLSKEPLAMAVRKGDDQWANIVTWSVNAFIEAEELGITSQNVNSMLDGKNAELRRFLGDDTGLGEALGIDRRFAYDIVKTIGNYGEIFERHLGTKTPIGLQRGRNALWLNGGLIFSPPFR
jgi:general L-amino acid transport system substrate-binding protein